MKFFQDFFEGAKNASAKAKAGVAVAGTALMTTASQAAVTYDGATGFGGSIDLTAYNTAIPLVITVVGVTIATTLGINALKKAK